MKIFQKTIEVKTRESFEFIKIDDEIQGIVDESGIKNGFILLRSLHTTAALVCTEPDETIHRDTKKVLKNLLPDDLEWEHTYEGRVNAQAHQANLLLGSTQWLPIKNGKIVLGTWQGFFLVELFEGRRRRVEVIVVGDPTSPKGFAGQEGR